jgi:hypothetical protein
MTTQKRIESFKANPPAPDWDGHVEKNYRWGAATFAAGPN